ncbi:hypothetical protein B0H14DRAFT_2627450 [Mycena olivaceomarginata]|nr:hypothetical protein B0H14DRAFT_2627450 [Mycena olivaceomarginata]
MIIVHSQCRFPLLLAPMASSLQLGYTVQCPYLWRWTTPIVVCAFLLLSASQQSMLQQHSSPLCTRNRSRSHLLSKRHASLAPDEQLHTLNSADPTASFTPQVLAVRDVIFLNGSIFNCTIVKAFNGLEQNATSVTSFLYYNNPFSDCNIVGQSNSTMVIYNST